jgi:hypothetical protein
VRPLSQAPWLSARQALPLERPMLSARLVVATWVLPLAELASF